MPELVVVKRRGRKEIFDERKIYASVYLACMSAYNNELKCEKMAENVTKKVKVWLGNKKLTSSNSIRKKVVAELRRADKKLEFYYSRHIPDLSRL